MAKDKVGGNEGEEKGKGELIDGRQLTRVDCDFHWVDLQPGWLCLSHSGGWSVVDP